MLTHLETNDGTPACGSKNPDPELSTDHEEVTCKRCLEAGGAAGADETEIAPHEEETKPGSKSGSRRKRAEFLSYEEVSRLCEKKSGR